jgi:L-lactate dehydrogenase complex protein LldF
MSSVFENEFRASATKLTADLRHRALIRTSLKGYEKNRDEKKARFQSWELARQAAAETKWEAINHLDSYLSKFADNLAKRGTKVFWASTAEDARNYILNLAREKQAKTIIKSKTMTSEEIHLNEALAKAGYEVVESDLGEYIVQLRGETPYHLVFPAMHLSRIEISDLFHKKLGTPETDNPEELTMIARRQMRMKYCQADIGISGANFAIAETGMISITENEGNARLTTSLPKIHVALLGIEKVLPKFSDLALFLPMLATAGGGQQLTCYNSMINGPRQAGEVDGPEEFHVVLLDNRRTQLLADAEQRDALHCIRCGACLNVCPIFRNVGGQTYGTTYQGPIGSVITPHLRGLKDWKHLSSASSLCGACSEICPVKIDLHHHLLHNRRNAAQLETGRLDQMGFGAFAFLVNHPKIFVLAARIGRLLQRLHHIVAGSKIDPLLAWTRSREAPVVAKRSFRQYWRSRLR